MQTDRKVLWKSPINMYERVWPSVHASRSSDITALALESLLRWPLENCQSPIGVQLLRKILKDKDY